MKFAGKRVYRIRQSKPRKTNNTRSFLHAILASISRCLCLTCACKDQESRKGPLAGERALKDGANRTHTILKCGRGYWWWEGSHEDESGTVGGISRGVEG